MRPLHYQDDEGRMLRKSHIHNSLVSYQDHKRIRLHSHCAKINISFKTVKCDDTLRKNIVTNLLALENILAPIFSVD